MDLRYFLKETQTVVQIEEVLVSAGLPSSCLGSVH